MEGPTPGRVWDVLILAGLVGLLLLARAGAGAPPESYRIGSGDVLKITVYGHEELSRLGVVAADGRMPLRGEATEAYRDRRTEELGRADWSIKTEVARGCVRQGHLREAVAAYEAAVRLAPQTTELRMELAALFTRIGTAGAGNRAVPVGPGAPAHHGAARRALSSFGMAAIEAATRP